MKKGTKYKKMNGVSYGQVKSLLNAGVKVSIASKATGIGYGTVNRISKSKDFTDYKENMLEYYRKYKRTTMPKNDSVAPVEGDGVGSKLSTAVTRRLDRMIDLLEEIKEKKIKLF